MSEGRGQVEIFEKDLEDSIGHTQEKEKEKEEKEEEKEEKEEKEEA